MKRLFLVLLWAASIALAGRASAQGAAPIDLKWNALPGCPSSEKVLSRVRQIAGSTRPTGNPLRAEATITQPSEGRFRLRLSIQSGELAAVRTIDGKSCKDLAGAAAVALALLLSSEEPLSERDLAGSSSSSAAAAGQNEGGAGEGTSSPNQPPVAPPVAPPPTAPVAPARPSDDSDDDTGDTGPARRWHVLLVAPLAALAAGPLPQSSRAWGLAAGVSFDSWRFLADGKLWGAQREVTTNLGDAYPIELKHFSLGARGCRALFGSRFELAPCLVMSVHHLSVLGSGPNLVSTPDATTWASVGLGVQARLLIVPWLGLVAGVDGELQLSRPVVNFSLPVTGSPSPKPRSVERLKPAAATVTLGAQWIF